MSISATTFEPRYPSPPPLAELPPLFRADTFGPDSRETRRLSRGAKAKSLVAVHPGVFARASEWDVLSAADKHRLAIHGAMPKLSPRLAVSHRSALSFYGLPTLGDWPEKVHVTDPQRSSSQEWSRVVKHGGPLPESGIETVDGVRVTNLVRTVVDVALTEDFQSAVMSADAALRRPGVTLDALRAELAGRSKVRARMAALRTLEFASPKSDSGGESRCRCRLFELGTPTPELQRVFSDSLGAIGAVDFWFEDYGVVVEFDGDVKYLDARFSSGLSASEIVLKERRRERRLLALPEIRTVIRADWRDVDEVWRLRRLLIEAGVPVR